MVGRTNRGPKPTVTGKAVAKNASKRLRKPRPQKNRQNPVTRALTQPDPRLVTVARAIDRDDMETAYAGFIDLLKAYPNNAVFWEQYGQVQNRRGNPDETFLATQRAVLINPKAIGATVNLSDFGKGYLSNPRLLALTHWGQNLAPHLPHNYFNRANYSESVSHQADRAFSDFQRALVLDPRHAKAMYNLQRNAPPAQLRAAMVVIARAATIIAPLASDYWEALGVALKRADRLNMAENAYHRAVILAPGQASIWYNFSNLMQTLSRDWTAIRFSQRAIAIASDRAVYHWNLSLLQLLVGDFENGWKSYAWRWRWSKFNTKLPESTVPQWQGEDLRGRHLLVFSEQGIGDIIQFTRYLPVLEQTGAKITFRCPAELHRLFQHTDLKVTLIAAPASVENCDFIVPLLNLPALFPKDGESPLKITLPKTVPPPPSDDSGDLRVGLVWAGNPDHWRDHERSINLGKLAPLLKVPGVRFYALQHGAEGRQVDDLGWRQKITDYGNTKDLFETAENIEKMDLVITIDSAVAHLAATLGKPTWIMITDPPDWRWHRGTNSSRWYPSVTLFRQTKRNNWDDVIDALTKALARQVTNPNAPLSNF